MITIHRQLKYVLFFALGLFFGSTAFASAYTLDSAPVYGTYNQYTLSWLNDTTFCNGSYNTGYNGGSGYFPANEYRLDLYDLNTGLHIYSPAYTTGSGNTFTATSSTSHTVTHLNVNCGVQGYWTPAITSIVWSPTGLFILSAYTVPTNIGGAFSFVNFDDVSPTDMVASVREGTIETTGKTLPLLVFLGIPLAFLLLVMVSKLISDTVKPEKRGNGRGWTAHGAMEHDLTEFKKKERSRIKRDL